MGEIEARGCLANGRVSYLYSSILLSCSSSSALHHVALSSSHEGKQGLMIATFLDTFKQNTSRDDGYLQKTGRNSPGQSRTVWGEHSNVFNTVEAVRVSSYNTTR